MTLLDRECSICWTWSWISLKQALHDPWISLSTYAPTSLGQSEIMQSFRCENVAGRGWVYYSNGPCSGHFPYKVGRFFSNKTPLRGHGIIDYRKMVEVLDICM